MRVLITSSILAMASAGQMAGHSLGTAVAQTANSARYTAAQFYQTRTYAIGGLASDAFSHDGKSVLISSDETGTFNAYRLPVSGGPAIPLTRSTTTATYAVSAFPKDDRVLVSSDGGGDELTHICRFSLRSDPVRA